MTLNIDLKPKERIIIANVLVRNGDRRTRLTFENQAKFLREKDMIPVSEASTACEHLYILLQMIYFIEINTDLEIKFITASKEIMNAAPSTAQYISEIYGNITAGEYYLSLKNGQRLINHEKELLGRL